MIRFLFSFFNVVVDNINIDGYHMNPTSVYKPRDIRWMSIVSINRDRGAGCSDRRWYPNRADIYRHPNRRDASDIAPVLSADATTWSK